MTPWRRDCRSKLSRSPRARERGLPAGFCLEQVAAPFFCFTAPSPIGSSRWSACDSCGAPATRCWRSIFERTAKAPAIESRWASSNPGRAVGAQVAPRAFARRTRGGARDIDGRLSDAYRTADRGRRRDRRIRATARVSRRYPAIAARSTAHRRRVIHSLILDARSE